MVVDVMIAIIVVVVVTPVGPPLSFCTSNLYKRRHLKQEPNQTRTSEAAGEACHLLLHMQL